MNNFVIFCVGFVITLVIMVVTFLLNLLLEDCHSDDVLYAWISSSIGFGICLTILLVQNGMFG